MGGVGEAAPLGAVRLRQLQAVGVLSGFAAGAWLGAAEAPTKVVTLGISPVAISLVMVLGVFVARWSLPALIRGTANVGVDVRRAPHLVIWALIAGCLWAVANTLTIFAIRDIGLSIAFPLWNTNSLLGILWGALLFNELRGAGRTRRMGVLGGAVVMFGGAMILALVSHTQAPGGSAVASMPPQPPLTPTSSQGSARRSKSFSNSAPLWSVKRKSLKRSLRIARMWNCGANGKVKGSSGVSRLGQKRSEYTVERSGV